MVKYISDLNGIKTFKVIEASEVLVETSTGTIDLQTEIENLRETIENNPSLMNYIGAIDCSGNPNYPAADVGDVYTVSVAGKIGGASGEVVEAGDMIVCNATSLGGDEATVGTDFDVIQKNIDGAVTSSSSSSTDENLAIFDGTTGKIIQDSGIAKDDVTIQGNTFNGPNQLVRLDGDSKLPAVDGSQLTNLPIQYNKITIPAKGALTAKDIVTIINDGGTVKAKVANATDGTAPARGFVLIDRTDGQDVDVYLDGQLTGLSGLTVGAQYYLATTDGDITTTMPTATGNIVQFIGTAISTSAINFTPGESIVQG